MSTGASTQPANFAPSTLFRSQTVHYGNIANRIGCEGRTHNPHFLTPRRCQSSSNQRLSIVTNRFICKRGNRYTSDNNQNSPWRRKIILSLDGGGVKGYGSLLILQKLMEYVEEEEKQRSFRATSSGAYPWGRSNEGQPVQQNTPGCQELNSTISPSSVPNCVTSPGIYLPCHYFDYIAGTSAGGLSAIMLGRLRMSVQEALDQYEHIGNKIFGKPRHFHMKSWKTFAPRPKFKRRNVERAIVKVITQKLTQEPRTDKDNAKHAKFASDESKCRTIVTSHLRTPGWADTYLFRSYDHHEDPDKHTKQTPRDPGPACQEKISKVALATSAAPLYFEPVQEGNKTFTDGGMKANNPASLALDDVIKLHGQNPRLLLSIGTGKKQAKKSKSRSRVLTWMSVGSKESKRSIDSNEKVCFPWFGWLNEAFIGTFQNMKDGVTDVESTAIKVKNECRDRDIEHYRWNTEPGYPTIKLDSWQPAKTGRDTLNILREKTQVYLSRIDIDRELQSCAKTLVDYRQARAETVRWEEFAGDYRYYCEIDGCRSAGMDAQTSFSRRDDFRDHLFSEHPIVPYRYIPGAKNNDDRLVCSWDHGEQIRSFKDEMALGQHLRQAHGMADEIKILNSVELEDRLDAGRKQQNTPSSSRATTPS